jgi:hypothetical protein
MMFPLLVLALMPHVTLANTTTTTNNTDSIKCRYNQWLCGNECIHRRSFCTELGTCHSKYAKPCGDGSRCYHRLDNCWESACLNMDCQGNDAIKHAESTSKLDRTQVGYLSFYCFKKSRQS